GDRLRRHDDRSCDLRLDVAEAALEPRAAARRLLVRSNTHHAEHSDPRALRGHLEHCLGARVSEVLQPRGDADVPRAGVRRDAFPLPWRRVYVSANRKFKRPFPGAVASRGTRQRSTWSDNDKPEIKMTGYA